MGLLDVRWAMSNGRLSFARVNQFAVSLLHTGQPTSPIIFDIGACSALCLVVLSGLSWHSAMKWMPVRTIRRLPDPAPPHGHLSICSMPGMTCMSRMHSMMPNFSDGTLDPIIDSQLPDPLPLLLLNHDAATRSPAVSMASSTLSAFRMCFDLDIIDWSGHDAASSLSMVPSSFSLFCDASSTVLQTSSKLAWTAGRW